jgi:hypothetical protein
MSRRRDRGLDRLDGPLQGEALGHPHPMPWQVDRDRVVARRLQ